MTSHDLCPSGLGPPRAPQGVPCSVTAYLQPPDQEQATQRITNARSQMGPLGHFVKEKMHLPFALHDCPASTLKQVAQVLSTGEKTLDLTDLLSMLKESLVSLVPFYWFTFALDVSTVYASTGHFIENTQEADTTRRQVIAVVVVK